jgi:hypothetical protein
MRQEHDGAGDPRAAAALGVGRGRGPAERRVDPQAGRGRRPTAPMEGHRHGVPGRDERAEPGQDRRGADRRADGAARSRRGRERAETRRSAARDGRHSGVGRAKVPARVLGRDAAARRARDGAGMRAQGPAGPRADHRARRHGAGTDPRAPVRARRRARAGPDPRHARPAGRLAGVRAGGGDVCGRDRGGGDDGPAVPRSPASVHEDAVRGHARPYGDEDVASIPGAPPRLDREIVGCPFRSRCDRAFDRCARERPVLRWVEAGGSAACHLNDLPVAMRGVV